MHFTTVVAGAAALFASVASAQAPVANAVILVFNEAEHSQTPMRIPLGQLTSANYQITKLSLESVNLNVPDIPSPDVEDIVCQRYKDKYGIQPGSTEFSKGKPALISTNPVEFGLRHSDAVQLKHPIIIRNVSRITVVPASTKVGKETVRLLLASEEKPIVQAVYRDPSKAPAEFADNPNFEAIKGDVGTGDGLDFGGSDAVLYVPPPTYDKVDQGDWAVQAAANVKNALRGAGIKRFVLLSALGAQNDHGIGIVRLNHITEKVLQGAASEVTILRPTHFLEEFRYLFQAPLGDPPIIPSWMAPGDYKVPFVSSKDIGETCVKYLLAKSGKPSPHILKIFGPRPYGSNDLKSAFEEVTGGKAELKLLEGDELEAFFGQIFPGHAIQDFMEMTTASLGDGVITRDYDYDENTVRGKVELIDVLREVGKQTGDIV
ncbi:hypothetical protein ACJZ2D_011961 [Fusarium nematophilum]